MPSHLETLDSVLKRRAGMPGSGVSKSGINANENRGCEDVSLIVVRELIVIKPSSYELALKIEDIGNRTR